MSAKRDGRSTLAAEPIRDSLPLGRELKDVMSSVAAQKKADLGLLQSLLRSGLYRFIDASHAGRPSVRILCLQDVRILATKLYAFVEYMAVAVGKLCSCFVLHGFVGGSFLGSVGSARWLQPRSNLNRKEL